MSEQGLPENFAHFTAVIHLAALVHQRQALPEAEYFKINTEQTLALAKAAKAQGVSQFVFFSTVAVYGFNGFINGKQPLLNENSPCQPTTAYGKSKLAAEQQLLALSDERFRVAIIRPPIVYGSNCPGNMTRLKKLLQRLPVLPLGNQQNKRSMVAIANLTRFTEEILKQHKAGIFIAQDAEQLSIQHICQALAAKQSHKPLLITLPNWVLRCLHRLKPQMIESLYGQLVFDSSESEKILQYKAVISAEKALSEV